MLGELCALTGWTRQQARHALGQVLHGWAEQRRGPEIAVYGTNVAGPLTKIWAALDGPASKRLAPFMADVIEASERHGELELSPEIRESSFGSRPPRSIACSLRSAGGCW